MKKLSTLCISVLFFSLCHAQIFPNRQRSLLGESGIYTCGPCYSWAVPMADTIKSRYGSDVICYSMEGGDTVSAVASGASTWMQNYVNRTSLGVSMASPVMFVNEIFMDHSYGDTIFQHNACHTIDSTNATPVVASPIFSVTNVGTDSMDITTKVKFLQAADGDYRVAIWLLQDSIYYMQTGAAGGYCYHMHQLTGPEPVRQASGDTLYNGNDSMCYTLRNGHIPINTIFTNYFHFKMKPTQVLRNMVPVVIVWKFDTAVYYDPSSGAAVYVGNLYKFVNGNETPGISSLATPAPLSASYTATVYPNPASTSIQVKLEGITEDVTMSIYDAAGRTVLSQPVINGQSVDVSNLAAGSYIYSLQVRGRNVMTGKIAIEK